MRRRKEKPDQNAVAELTREWLYKENKWLWEENKKLEEENRNLKEELEWYKEHYEYEMDKQVLKGFGYEIANED